MTLASFNIYFAYVEPIETKILVVADVDRRRRGSKIVHMSRLCNQ